jgi:hypothetical protein
MLYIKLKKEGLIMKKRIVAMVMALTMAVGLAGCGGSGSASSSTNAGTGASSATGKNLTVSLSDAIHANEYSIWYSASAVDKDKKPEVYVLYNDGTYIKGEKEYTFKELSEMTDEDVVSFAQSSWNAEKDSAATNADSETAAKIAEEKGFPGYQKYYFAVSESKKDSIADDIVGDVLSTIAECMEVYGYLDYIEGYSDIFEVEGEEAMLNDEIELTDFWLSVYHSNRDEIWTWLANGTEEDDFFVSIKEQYIAAASEACDSELATLVSDVAYDRGTYTIHARTDSTGNNVQSEGIIFSEDDNKNITGILQPQAILECYYGGYTLSNGDGAVLVVRTSSDITFSLDTKDAEGIEVD